MRSLLLILILMLCGNTFAQTQTNTPESLNRFPINIYKKISTSQDNLLFSPYSLSSVLILLAEGASGNTAKQLFTMLFIPSHLSKADKSIAPNKKMSAQKVVQDFNDKKSQFSTANGLWVKKDIPLKNSFLQNLNLSTPAEIKTVDFTDINKARALINDWVEKQTKGMIGDFLPAGAIQKSTQLLLINALYFKGQWETPFEKEQTKNDSFKLDDGTQVSVPMMQTTARFNYFEDTQAQTIILPYRDSSLAMAIILPKSTKVAQFNTLINDINQILNLKSRSIQVQVYLPRFTFSSTFTSLKNALTSLGMRDAFTERADFSNMTTQKLIVSDVIQKTVISVDEAGTTAAAASGVVMFGSAAPSTPKLFRADHPFLFIIFDRSNKAILFIGQVANPSKTT